MSAIAGLWQFDDKPAADDCERMLAAQALYGPHHGAAWSDGGMALGRRLYRVLPEDAHDRGPVVGGGGRYVLVADLRLDAREDLGAALDLPIERARGLCDAALLMAAFERWDIDCLPRLVGCFAFALWDRAEQRMILARDFVGARPLFYHRGKSFFAFASMAKGLHALPDIPYGPDEQRAAEFLAVLPEHGSRTFFKGIERVEAGHVAIITRSGVEIRRHWNPVNRLIRFKRPEDYVEALRGHLDTAVKAQMRRAHGSLATHLSGGFDSAAVTATAARFLAPSGERLTAFTSVPREGYEGPDPINRFGDEGALAAATARLYPNIDHVLIRTRGASPIDQFDRNFLLYEQPARNPCNIVWGHAINDEARRRGVSVMLIGAFGNLTISQDGNQALADMVARGALSPWLTAALNLTRRRAMRWGGVLAASFGPWTPPAVWRWLRARRPDNVDIRIHSALNPERLPDLEARFRDNGFDRDFRPRRDSFETRVRTILHNDAATFHPGTLAGWRIDLRDPTADKRLVEFALNIPGEELLRGGIHRSLGRRALADRLPAELLAERRRGIQAIDWHEGLTAARPQLADEISRLAENAPAARTVDLPKLRRLVDDWPEGGWERQDVIYPYRLALLRALSAGHFLRKATGGNA